MKSLPTKMTKISSNTIAKPLSMNLGGKITAKVTDKGNSMYHKGEIIEIDINEVNHADMLWVTPIGENFN